MAYVQGATPIQRLGNVDITGLSLSSAMRNDLSGGMSAADFNSKYSKLVSGFQPISLKRQLAAAAPAAAPAPAAPPAPDPEAIRRQQLESEVAGLFGELKTNDANMRSPVDIYNQALEGLGLADARTRVSGLREQLFNTESLLRNIAGDIQARTQDSLVTENQRRRLEAVESAPLAEQVNTFSRALEGARGDYQDILGEGKTQAELTFQGDQAKRQALMDRLKIAIDRSDSAEDKRRWQAEYDRLKAQDEEAKRQFNAQLALDQQKLAQSARSGGGGGGGGGSSSSKATQQQAQQQVSNYILTSGQRGRDGYLSPVTYKQLRSEWVGAGWNASDFDSAFKMYANPTHLRDYGL